jgi:hypothetical protein
VQIREAEGWPIEEVGVPGCASSIEDRVLAQLDGNAGSRRVVLASRLQAETASRSVALGTRAP